MVIYLKAERYRSSSKPDNIISSNNSFLYLFESNKPELGEKQSYAKLRTDTSCTEDDGRNQVPFSNLSGQQRPMDGSTSNQSSLERKMVAKKPIVSPTTLVRSFNHDSNFGTENRHDGFTSQQLIDRLLSSVLSTKGLKYIKTFLALYRFFLSPADLLEAIVKAFHFVSCSGRGDVISAVDHLRYLTVFEMWVKDYPGDFALLPTHSKARDFIEQIRRSRILSVAANELSLRIANVMEDDNTYWAFNDLFESSDAKAQRVKDDASLQPFYGNMIHKNVNFNYDILYSHNILNEKNSRTEATLNGKGANPETYHERLYMTQSLIPEQQSEFTKTHWRQLISESEESIAKEMTRIDWILFSSFCPRDLIRHVTLAPDAKRCCRKLGNVDRMINHFNHIAYWVTNIILVRDKAKHRALMMMKLMKVARVST